jgi:hypothetical protein
MVNSTDMATPVTRGELRDELMQLRREFKQQLEPLATKAELEPLATKAELKPLATKVELEFWGGALLARLESSERRLLEHIDRGEQRLHAELARHANALHESMARMISTIDDKYADLPGRVNRLETTVFGSGQR